MTGPAEPQIPRCFPPTLTAGTTFKVDRSFPGYPTSDWSYQLLLAGAQTLAVAGTADASDGSTFHVVATPSQTQQLNPSGGVSLAYQYVERLTATGGSGEVWDVASGRIMVEPNLATAAPGDTLSHAERTLAVIEAAIEGRLTDDIENYSIAGRSISKIPARELVQLRGTYRAMVWKERNPGKLMTRVDVTFPIMDTYGIPGERRPFP